MYIYGNERYIGPKDFFISSRLCTADRMCAACPCLCV